VRPFRARMICGWASCSRVIFSQKSPFAFTVHTFGVRGIPGLTYELMMHGPFSRAYSLT
jgi:hypothetical protein